MNVPPGLERWLEFGTLIFADFEACPLTKDKAGHMRIVLVKTRRIFASTYRASLHRKRW